MASPTYSASREATDLLVVELRSFEIWLGSGQSLAAPSPEVTQDLHDRALTLVQLAAGIVRSVAAYEPELDEQVSDALRDAIDPML